MCVCLLCFERSTPGEKQARGISPEHSCALWGGGRKQDRKIKPRRGSCECKLRFRYRCSGLGTLNSGKNSPVPTDTFPLVCLDGRVLSMSAHMVVAPAITRVSEVMQVDRFSVGEYQH